MNWPAIERLLSGATEPVRAAARSAAMAPVGDRRRAARALADRLGHGLAPLVANWLESGVADAHDLALRLLAVRPAAGLGLLKHVRPRLREGQAPLSVRLAATRALLDLLPPDSRAELLLLRSFTAGLGRRPAERLTDLAGRLGRPAAISRILAELAERQKMRCPRCGALRRRKAMRRHLWNHHQLVLDGRRALTPAQALDQRLADTDDAAVVSDFHRDLLAAGLRDEEALDQLLDAAAERFESLCPGCFAFVPAAEPPPPGPAELAPGRLSAPPARVTLTATRSGNRLHVETDRVIYDGREPGRAGVAPWSRIAAVASVALAWASALAMPTPWNLVTSFGMAGLAAVALLWAWRKRRAEPGVDRVVDHAWNLLVPHLMAGEPLARIALASIGRGTAARRATARDEARAAAEAAVQIHAAPGWAPAALWALEFADARGDPVPAAVDAVGRCWDGELPLTVADAFARWLPAGSRERRRLQILASERAFAAGLGVWDLAEIARAFPALGDLVGAHDLDGLARRRLIWFDRFDKPWRLIGPAVTAFDFARRTDFPFDGTDLLLYCPLPALDSAPGDYLLICGRGLVFRGAVMRGVPASITIREREDWRGGGWDLHVGPHRFRYDVEPRPVAERLLAWSAWWFDDYLPRVDAAMKYRSGRRLGQLLAPHERACPSCGRRVIPTPGAVAAVPTLGADQ